MHAFTMVLAITLSSCGEDSQRAEFRAENNQIIAELKALDADFDRAITKNHDMSQAPILAERQRQILRKQADLINRARAAGIKP